MNELIAADIQTLSPSSIIELYVLDCTALGGSVFRFHNGTNHLQQNIVWQGETYTRFPIEVTGFEMTGQGQLPRPTVKVSNVLSAITTILMNNNDLLDAKFTRKRTLQKYLDAVNFAGGVNPTADPAAYFADDVYWVDRKSMEDRDQVQFELASAADLQGTQLPKRVVTQNICAWIYRGVECGYTGIPLWDEKDNTIPLPPASAAGQTLIAAYNAMNAAKANVVSKQSLAETAKNNYQAALVYTQTAYYNVDSAYAREGRFTISAWPIPGTAYFARRNPVLGTFGYFAGSKVFLGGIYTSGAYRESWTELSGSLGNSRMNSSPSDFYEILHNTRDESNVAAKLALYNTALVNVVNAQVAYGTTVSTFNAALAALPTDDQMYSQDKCGKRINSCKKRFGVGQIPFGGFPGVQR